MNVTKNFLTDVHQDWTDANLAVAMEVLREAEELTLERTDSVADPILDSPNLANVQGQMRWLIVGRCLELAVASGRFSGLKAEWIDLGGAYVIELRGKFSTLIACTFNRQTKLHVNQDCAGRAGCQTKCNRCWLDLRTLRRQRSRFI